MTHNNRVVRVDSLLGNEDWLGKLTLHYFTGDSVPVARVIPFFENPTIIESQNPRYMNYAPVGRSSNLFGYLGADSRKFNLSFKLNLPHITSLVKQYSNLWSTPPTKLQKRKEILEEDISTIQNIEGLGSEDPFADPDTLQSTGGQQEIFEGRSEIKDIKDKQKHFKGIAEEIDLLYEDLLAANNEPASNLKKFLAIDSKMLRPDSDGTQWRRSVINSVASLVASISSTVINNNIDPQYGPPLVRLDWGILYRDVPCVCKGYTINVNGKAGYDKQTLLPRVLEVTMSLEEARNLRGNAFAVQANDLIGWEVLVGTEQSPGLTMDPGNFTTWKSKINT